MTTTINDISTAQKASWNRFSPGWKKQAADVSELPYDDNGSMR